MRRFVLVTAFMLLAVIPGAAKASVTYSYIVGDTSADASNGINFSTTSGGTVTVNLYLHEALTGNSTSLIVGDNGMAAAGASITLASGNAALQSSSSTVNLAGFGAGSFRYGNDGSVNGNPSGTPPTPNNPNQTAFGVQTANGVGTASGVNPDANGNILIGTVQILATSGVSTFTLAGYPPPGLTSGNTITTGTGSKGYGPLDLDFTNNSDVSPGSATYSGTRDNPTSFTVTVQTTSTPEPSSMLLCGLAASGMGFGAWRRRKAKLNAEAATIVSEVAV